MNIEKDYSLKEINAFGVDVKAKYFVEIEKEKELKELLAELKQAGEKSPQFLEKTLKTFVIGQTYNTLFVNDFDGLIIKINIKGIDIIEETETSVTLRVGAGENWPDLVEFAVNNNWQGIENLADIPGSTGAAPIQNIGAYGQVLEDVFVSLEAYEVKTGQKRVFSKEECEFAYRKSIFKKDLKDKYIVTSIKISLQKVQDKFIPETSYHSRYESLSGELEALGRKAPYSLKDIFDAVVSLRSKKLPSVEKYGTIGSTFVNPFISKEKLTELQKSFPEIQYYPVDKMQYPGLADSELADHEIVKIPAGWILEELGWKGKWIGNVGTYEKHSMIVVTNKKASGQEILDFIRKLQKSVKDATGINLSPEVNIVI